MTAPTVMTGKDVLAYLTRLNGEGMTITEISKRTDHGEGIVRLAVADLLLTSQIVKVKESMFTKYCVPTNHSRLAERRINSNYGTPPMKIERRRAEIYEELAKARAATPSRHIPEVV